MRLHLSAFPQLVLFVGVAAQSGFLDPAEDSSVIGHIALGGNACKPNVRAGGVGCGRHIEALQNDGEGLSYMGAAMIGTSYVTHIVWDTGSDQMVVTTSNTFMPQHPCMMGFSNLGYGACYVPEIDPCHERDSDEPSQIEYGSGGASIYSAHTTMFLNDGECPIKQPVMELDSSDIDVLIDGNINAVGGMSVVGDNDFNNVRQFSFCAQAEDVSAPGVWVWNDFKADENPLFPGNFSDGGMLSLPVLHPENPYYWAVPAEKVEVNGQAFGCPFGCAAIIDTGTSFISLTHGQMKGLEQDLNKIDDCDEESVAQLPDINFYFQGNKLSMGPQEYIRIWDEEEEPEAYVPDWWQEYTDYWRGQYPNSSFIQKKKTGSQCYLALAPPVSESKDPQEDNVLILGDSFMRGFYTTFNRDDKSVSFAQKMHTDCNLQYDTPEGGYVTNEDLIQRNKERMTGMAYSEKQKYNLVQKKDKTVKRSTKLRKLHPGRIMLSDGYHQLKRRGGSLEKAHEALFTRKQVIRNATRVTHKEM